MTRRVNVTGRMLLPVVMLCLLAFAYKTTGNAQAQTAAAQPPPRGTCPGQAMPVQATGVYSPTEVPDIVINGKPGARCHLANRHALILATAAGGRIMMVDQGVGRVQKRGEKMRVLRRGDTEYAPPGVEHGTVPRLIHRRCSSRRPSAATALWMEESGRTTTPATTTASIRGTEFLKTGVRKKTDPNAPTVRAPVH